MRIELTQDFISKGLHCPEGRQKIEYTDSGPSGVPGLFIEVTARSPGKGSWYLRYKNIHAQTCYQRLGTTGDLTLAEARKEAKQQRARIVLGADPRAEARARKAVPLFRDFWELEYAPFIADRKRSADRDIEMYRLRLKTAFGDKQLTRISRKEIIDFHTSLLKEGLAPATADHYAKTMRAAMNKALEFGHIQSNVAARLPLFNAPNSIEHLLDDAELARLMHVLRTDRNTVVTRVCMLCLATGIRLGECLNCKWQDTDLERRMLVISATNSKSKRRRSVPLNDVALEVLNSLDTKGEFEYLFINRETRKPYTTVAKQWHRIREAAQLPHLRFHDLRHQFASFLVNDGRTLYEVQQILGHSDPKVTMRYAHLSTRALQDAANSASVKMRGEVKKVG